MPFLIEGLAVGQDTIKTFADYAARDAYYDTPDPHLDELIQGITTIFILDDGSGDPNMQRWFGDTDPAVYDSADWAIIPLSYVLPGTVDGQTLYWGNTALEWTPTDLLSVNPVAGTITINSVNGIDINPGSDIDVDLITVGVTGAPKLSWDDSAGLFVQENASAAVINAGNALYSLYADSNNNQSNIVAAFKFWNNGIVGTAVQKATIGWDETKDVVFMGYGAVAIGSGGDINIDSSGMVGIGTETPAAKLHIEGGARVDSSGLNTNVLQVVSSDNQNLGVFFEDSGGHCIFSLFDNAGAVYTRFYPNGSSYINTGSAAGKKLGIGTTTPQETIDINGYATAKDTLETTDDTVLNLKSISVAEGEDVSITIDIVGRRADGTERARYRITGLFYRNTSGNVTKEGSLQDVGTIDEDAWNAVDLVANTGTQEIDIELSPPDTTINWSSVIKYHKAVT